VVKLIYADSSFRFNMNIIFITNYSFNEKRCSVDNETILVTDFVNLKIKSTQSFRDTHRGIIYMCVYKNKYSYIYKYLRLIFFKHLSITVQQYNPVLAP
jgi:hypothetical protein